MDSSNVTKAEAAMHAAEKFPTCYKCAPSYCNGSKKYWRFNDSAPCILYAQTHWLSSIPSEHRIPHSAVAENVTDFLSQKENQYPHTKRLYLFEFNPSITRIPEKYPVPNKNNFYAAAGKDKPVYMASYRVSHKHGCFANGDAYVNMYGGGSWDVANKINRTDYLGLALLSEDLTIFADTVVSMKGCFHRYEDYRLFTLHDPIYLTSRHHISPIYLTSGNVLDTKQKEFASPNNNSHQGFPVWIRRYDSCPLAQ
jgi:hypothetical protein